MKKKRDDVSQHASLITSKSTSETNSVQFTLG